MKKPPKVKQPPPFAFVLDELEALGVTTRPMFGTVAIYADNRILFCLRDKDSHPFDNGVWIGTTPEHHASLREELPAMRSIALLTETDPKRVKQLPLTGWQNIPASAPDFEEQVLRACALARSRDPRIGKVPASRKRR